MSLKEILVVLDNSPQCASRLELAVALARQHGACLAGLHVITHPFYEPAHNDAPCKAEEVRRLFEAMTGSAGIPVKWIGVDWSVVGVAVAEIVNLHAHYVDLVIVGQDQPRGTDSSIPPGLPERVVMGAGRPVLVVPYTGSHLTISERVMISWKGGRESARAANDALPLLQYAKDVCVLELNTESYGNDAGQRLCEHLAAHGIKAHPKDVAATDISIGDLLLNRIATEGSTLLVMGASAPARLGTSSLGEVARHILKHMTVPVLMSH
ncbi:universal stress protein [Geobacter argillaceus]|uniref:Nucleotide-binding universal stress UspA family protein n=1 Tax=Geobacter argillaceus TaxID=345631 RepID=A0A562WR47_9BACT|nr:universal stress protein [Geobacter argillaceus]TWJ32626.1 nucleotide-binding universal stress UspA family protein [Geobacter argillaceus]